MSAFRLLAFLRRYRRDQAGTTAIEYALIAALVFIAIVSSVAAMGTGVVGLFTSVAGAFPAP